MALGTSDFTSNSRYLDNNTHPGAFQYRRVKEKNGKLIQLGIRTASEECICNFPQKRCEKKALEEPSIGSRIDGSIHYIDDQDQSSNKLQEISEGNFPNKEYKQFPL